ncbi:protocatechuate 3,4-dioxygenase [Marinomonas primoryensis]|uniref:3-carboxyethylcatechol 2,3-dioxygenase n=1 Tax=Marinomonas primoryensis TaxID=178399 RepID=A0A859CYX9_9GAMM|nr:protocatechuate 3,4-dioxygenase [Marinomonas primoryensis]QKK81885.1 3-carboxyethylcatechol 2,3-dioxygenase [Marinomonas primoryensis]
MATIVSGFLVPHDPIMFVAPDAPAKDIADKAWGAYETCAVHLADLDVDTVIIIGNDHYMLFGTTCLPQYCIATGDLDGPLDQMPGLKRQLIPNDEALATHIATHGHADGFDWAVARSFTTDHSFSIPFQKIVQRASEIKGKEIKAIPVYLASAVDPFLSMQRSQQLGQAIAKAVKAFKGDERIAVIGSGGISHWVGTKESGTVNEDFDREILAYCLSLDEASIMALSDERILSEGGNGAMELRNFVCAMAAVEADSSELIEYQPVPEWVTGLGFVELKKNPTKS